MSVIHLPIHRQAPAQLIPAAEIECWQCGSIQDLVPDRHTPDVYYCRDCFHRVEKPHSFDDLGVGD